MAKKKLNDQFTSATGGTIRPGGPSKGKKTNEYWGAVQADLTKQIGEVTAKGKKPDGGAKGKTVKATNIKKSDFI